jgi:hypothetical protein
MEIGMLDEVRELREVGEAFLRALANLISRPCRGACSRM